MPLSVVLPPSSPAHVLRLALMGSLHQAHRPELADVIESADLLLERGGVWVRPERTFAGINPDWLEPQLLAAAVGSGLRIRWIRVLSTNQGGEVC